MEQNDKLTIFHLYRKDGTALFLHPFDSLEKLVQVLKKANIVGKYGTEPRVESLTLFRNDLYRLIEEAVRSWVAEKRFIPRFIVSAVVFLVAYLFMSFIIRDPIPMVDEILVGAGVAFATYFLISRRDQRSNMALRKRVELRTSVDRIVFSEDRFLRQIEEVLQQHDTAPKESLLEELVVNDMETRFDISDEEEAKQLIRYFEKRFNTREYRKPERLLSRTRDKRREKKNLELLSRWSESKKIDLSLFTVYRRVKRSYTNVK
jgi:hypothetical protein